MAGPLIGITLLVHITVILFATTWNYVNGLGDKTVLRSPKINDSSLLQQTLFRVLSIVIFFGFSFLTFVLISFSVTSAVEEGSDEPHRMFMSAVVEEMTSDDVDILDFTRTITYIAQ